MDTNFFQNKLNRTLATVALVFVIIALASYANYAWKQAKYMYQGPTTISFTGEGEVRSVPNVGQFTFTITESAPEATNAQNALKAKMDDIVAYLKGEGVEEKDIKTSGYNLYPKYDEVIISGSMGGAMPAYSEYRMPTKQEQIGFEVSETVTVKVRDLNKAGAMLSQVGDKGASSVSSLEFVIDEDDALKAEARKAAIADAKKKAEELAKELNVRLGQMVGFYEDEGMNMPYYEGMGGDMMVKSMESAESANIQIGENVVKSRVTITYQVKGRHGGR